MNNDTICLNYPFDSERIIRKRKKIKRGLLSNNENFLMKRVAILGGSTTDEIKNILELFLLHHGIKPSFYESEYNRFYEDAVFDNEKLDIFHPDLVYIHTSYRNIEEFPFINDLPETIDLKLQSLFNKFQLVWESLRKKYGCIIIQNNFEYPYYRMLGNKDATDIHGRVNFITRLNLKFAEYAECHDDIFINDINYQSAQYGIDKWQDPSYWYLYKYSLSLSAIPTLAFNVANIIKALYGKNKKAFAVDLDNTLWGGVVGDDGQENLEIGQETSNGEAFYAFQEHLKAYKEMGVLLNINSKNDMENALAGLNHPNSILKDSDFIIIKANWKSKASNLFEIAKELNIGIDSIVFVDDNPAEREIINQEFPQVATPWIDNTAEYSIKNIDHAGFFECVSISKEDFNKSEMYKQNLQRQQLTHVFTDYNDYLKSLDMKASINSFREPYIQRIVQLTNKSNQFNLTTKRYTQTEIETVAADDNYLTLFGRLKDRFGDNGVVSLIIGRKHSDTLHIELWLMSCRVLKRDMEYAMMDTLVERAKKLGLKKIIGYYYPTKKNGMVKDFYGQIGFHKNNENEIGDSVWELIINDYHPRNNNIYMEE